MKRTLAVVVLGYAPLFEGGLFNSRLYGDGDRRSAQYKPQLQHHL